ncbi:hypothetical protein QBC46DRAFT_398755 [Diplogelasinospora grovesii]|uniref:F-box domain-containing protein n=1 Tax=Diplogelasinospora grovesii TaxID=303347 RepID=A0AAN6MXI7_9PEZI|nr:hypothetical protein QBC46DRAFT_398755 [Diplogelasinospora grovesii]
MSQEALCFRAPDASRPSSPSSILLRQPVEVLLAISEQLSDEAGTLALSLTCKALFHLLFSEARKRLAPECPGWEALLLLLEKDTGDKYYYCHDCRKLHLFEKLPAYDGSRNAGKVEPKPHKTIRWLQCVRAEEFSLPNVSNVSKSWPFTFDFMHARLVMNRHFYHDDSREMGLPLTIFEKHSLLAITQTPRYHIIPLTGKQDWTARIIDDELYLSATHILASKDVDSCPDFRQGIDEIAYWICWHTHTHDDDRIEQSNRLSFTVKNDGDYSRRVSGLDPSDDGTYKECTDLFKVCHFANSCHICLTDYTVRVEWREPEGDDDYDDEVVQKELAGEEGDDKKEGEAWTVGCTGGGGWVITIKTYHRLGSCRSPHDPIWRAFSDRNFMSLPMREGGPVRYRDFQAYPPYSVEKRWIADERGNKA